MRRDTITDPARPSTRAATEPRREAGIALFVVLIIGVILSVVIFQITYTSKIEQRIADNRRGYLEVSYSMHSVARDVILRVFSDWKQDVDAEEDEEAEGQASGIPGMPTPGAANQPADAESTEPIDSRHEEDWAYPYKVQVNKLDLDIRILDAEGRINLNRIFDYVMVPGEDDTDTTTAVPGPGTPGGRGANEPPDPAADEEEEEDLSGLEEEWEPPSEERQIRTEEMLSWLIEALIAYNEDQDYIYEDLQNPDNVATDILRFVLERQETPETRRILRVECLIPIVGRELFYGPVDPDAEEDEEDDEEFVPSSRYSGEDLGFGGSEFFGEDGINPESGYTERDDLERAPGVDEARRPVGLREMLTAYSAIKPPTNLLEGAEVREYPALNLNTAPVPVLVALLRPDFEFDEAGEVAWQIVDYLNSYAEEDTEDDISGDVTTDASTESTDDLTEEEEEDPIEFNVFRAITDLKEIDEEWAEDAEEIEAVNESIYTRLEKNFSKIAVFRSTYFTAYLDGKLDAHPIVGELVLERHEDDDENREVRVVYWREHLKR